MIHNGCRGGGTHGDAEGSGAKLCVRADPRRVHAAREPAQSRHCTGQDRCNAGIGPVAPTALSPQGTVVVTVTVAVRLAAVRIVTESRHVPRRGRTKGLAMKFPGPARTRGARTGPRPVAGWVSVAVRAGTASRRPRRSRTAR